MALKIHKNKADVTHNTSVRKGKIEYICIHYVGATGDAGDNVEYYSRKTTTNASADFFVGHKGDIWQYNPDPNKRYCWAVGGARQSARGGTLYGKAKNANSISVELCVRSRGNTTQANHRDWYFEEATIQAAIELVRFLMEEYNVPAERVIRHYDVTGKYCPGVIGWNAPSGSERAWEEFRAALSGSDLAAAVDKLYQAGVINSPDYWKKGRGYSDANVVTLLKKVSALC